MEKATYHVITDPAELANTAIALVREQAPETRLLPIAARPVADHPEYQQVNRIGRDGVALKGGWTFLVNTTTRTVLRTVGDPDELDFETAMRRAMPIWALHTDRAPVEHDATKPGRQLRTAATQINKTLTAAGGPWAR